MSAESETYLAIYRLYYERLKSEGDWIWSRFKIYMTLNATAFAAVGLIFREIDFTYNEENVFKLIFIAIIAFIGRNQAIEWTNISKQGRFWESTITFHLAKIEKELNLRGVDLYSYLDIFELPENKAKYPSKVGMEHITNQMMQGRSDPIASNINVSAIFEKVFLLVMLASVIGLISFIIPIIQHYTV